MEVSYTPKSLRMFRSLPPELQEEIHQAIDDFRSGQQHVRLKVHKRQGRLNGRHAFSVNYRIRIVFQYEGDEDVILTAVGDHDVYRS